MGVKYKHPQYEAMAPKWKRCRDVASGQDAVHGAGPEYLPKLKDQTDDDYKAYVKRATFYNASWRTIAGLLGMLFRKPPKVEVPDSVQDYLTDITTAGVPFHVFAQQIAEECMEVGRVGVLVDYPMAPAVWNQEQEKKLNLRPTMQRYRAESIINWRTGVVDNKHVLTLVVLVEEHRERKDDFEDDVETRYRVLDLVEGKYRVRLFRVKLEDGKEVDEQIGGDFYPTMPGSRALTQIPFIFIGPDDITPNVDDPPLIDLVDLNLSHYMTTADYEHGCHFTGLPTAVVSGYSAATGNDGQPTEKLYVGSAAAWIFPDKDAKAAYLEFTGQGLAALENNLTRKEAQMAVLGARMLMAEKKAAEAAETAAIHRTGENSVLSSVAQTISLGLTNALVTFCEWSGADTEATIDLNRDFFPLRMDPSLIKELVIAWQKGAISFDTLFNNLKQGEVIADDGDVESERGNIAKNPALTDPAKEPPKE